MNEKVLVIGGGGNIGTSVVNLLLEKGYDVTIFTRGKSVPAPNPAARIILGDRRENEAEFISNMQKQKFDCVIDMCAQLPQDAENSLKAFPDIKQYVFISTTASYGVRYSREMPIREDFSSKDRPWEYSRNKKTIEGIFLNAYITQNFPITIIRPTVTYGRFVKALRQFGFDSSWIDRIRKGKPIITGNLQLLQHFIYVDDAAAAIVGALSHPDRTIGQAYNLVGLRPNDWKEYYSAAMHVLGKNVDMIEVPLDTMLAQQTEQFIIPDMVLHSLRYNGIYDGTKIARDIPEFAVRTSLEDGMAKQIAFLDEYNLIPNSDDYSLEDEIIRLQLATRTKIST